jgi:cyclophilin family peptidyl-prolyl cis-trans isomerase
MRRLFLAVFSCMVLVLVSSASGCKSKNNSTQVVESAAEAAPTPPPPPPPPAPLQAPTPDPKPKNALVKLSTIYGDMTIKLYDETPGHRDNFLMLAEKGFYDGLLFHRCIKGFMIQGGDPNSKGAGPGTQLGMGGPGYTVPAEFNSKLIHKKGALCAARQGDMANPTRSSSGSQFYVVQGSIMNDMQLEQMQSYVQRKTPGFTYSPEQKEVYKKIGGTPQLDMDYTVFGEVTEGLAVIDSIAKQPTMQGDRPVKDVIMNVKVIKK